MDGTGDDLTALNHSDSLLAYFQGLQENDRFLEVSTYSDGNLVAACHKLVLAILHLFFVFCNMSDVHLCVTLMSGNI